MNDKQKSAIGALIGNAKSCGVSIIPVGMGYDIAPRTERANTTLDYTKNSRYNYLLLKNSGNTDIKLWGCYDLCPGEHLVIGSQDSLNCFEGKIRVAFGKENTGCDCDQTTGDLNPVNPCLTILQYFLIGTRA